MAGFLVNLRNIFGKRKTGDQQLEVSPAKRTKQQQNPAMQDVQPESPPQPGSPKRERLPGDASGTAQPLHLTLSLRQQQLVPDPLAPAQGTQDPAGLQQQQAQVQQQQQQQSQQQWLQQGTRPDIAQVYQKLGQPPAGTTAATKQRAAQQARPKHMPVPRHPGAARAQDMYGPNWGHLGQQQHRPAPFTNLSAAGHSSSSPLAFIFTPGTGQRGSTRQQGDYGAYGPPPPAHHLLQHHPQQQQQQQQRGQPALNTAAAAAAGQRAAASFPGEALHTSRPYGSSAAAAAAAAGGQQHRAPVYGPAAAAAAGAAGRPGIALSSRGVSPPLQEVRQRLSYGGDADHHAPLLPAAAADRPADTAAAAAATALHDHSRPAGLQGRQTAAAGGGVPTANGAAFAAAVSTTPPVAFAAAYAEVTADLGVMHTALSSRAAAAEQRVREAQARFDKVREATKQGKPRVHRMIADIDRAFAPSVGYQPNRTDAAAQAALQQLEHLTQLHKQQHLEHEAALNLERQQQRLKREQTLLTARTPLKLPPTSPPGHQQQQQQQLEESLQQQQQQQQQVAGDDTDDDILEVVEVSSDDDETGSSEQQQDGVGAQANGVDEGAPGSDDDVDEAEGSSSEADEAAEAIHALGITTWMGRRSQWRPTPEQMARYNQATSGGGRDDEVLTSHQRAALELTRGDLATLRAGEWLNDECMNMYMALLQDRDTAGRVSGGLCCHYFNTFFLNKLYRDVGEYKYQNVRRWTLPARLKTAGQASDCVLKCDRVLIPVHEGNHWTALMVDIPGQRLVFFDSLMGRNTPAVQAVRRWVTDEAKDKLKVTWDTSRWQEVYPLDIPRQRNGYDCGVFALMFLNRMGLKGGAFDFEQGDIAVHVRAAITCDLLDRTIKATGSRD